MKKIKYTFLITLIYVFLIIFGACAVYFLKKAYQPAILLSFLLLLKDVIVDYNKKENNDRTADGVNGPIFMKKIEKNEKYSLSYIIKDVIKIKDSNIKIFLITLFFSPIIGLISTVQCFVLVNFLVFFLAQILIEDEVVFSNKTSMRSLTFTIPEIICITFIDYPKIRAYLIIYFLINRLFKEKKIDVLLNRLALSKISGISSNFLVKAYWFYAVVESSVNGIDYTRKKTMHLPMIFFYEVCEKYSLLISYSMSPLYEYAKTLSISKNKKRKLNPRYTEIVDFTKSGSMRIMFRGVFENLKDDTQNQLLISPRNILEIGIYSKIQDAVFNNKKHLGVLAIKRFAESVKIKESKKGIITKVFTHSQELKTNTGERIKGNLVKQSIDPLSGAEIPEDQTYSYTTAVGHEVLTDFKNFRIFQDYGVMTYRDLIVFRAIEDITISREIKKFEDDDEILWQGKSYADKKIVSFSHLLDNNMLNAGCCAYIFEKKVEIVKALENAADKLIDDFMLKTKGIAKSVDNQQEIAKIHNISIKSLADLEIFEIVNEQRTEVRDEIIKNFIKQIEAQPKQTTLGIACDALHEIGLDEGITGLINIHEIGGKQI